MNSIILALGFAFLIVVVGVLVYVLATRKPKVETVYKSVIQPQRVTRTESDFKPKPSLVLKVIDGLLDGQPKAVIDDRATLGADDSNDIVLNHPTVSGRHAEIIRDDSGSFHIYNRSRTSKVRVNGDEVSSMVLNDKDTVSLGAVKLQVIAA